MRIAQVFAHAVVRRVAFVLVALVLSYCGMQPAHAQTDPYVGCYGTGQGAMCPDAGIASQQAQAAANALKPANQFVCFLWDNANYSGSSGKVAWGIGTNATCSTGTSATYTRDYPKANTCAARPTDYGGYYQSPVSAKCHEGCSYTLTGVTATETVKDRLGHSYTYNRGNWGPTGSVCGTVSEPRPAANSDYCQTVEGGHQVCSNANGQKCVVSGKTGRSYCWTSTQAGPATAPTRDESFSKSQLGQPATAPIARDGENWQPTTNTSITNNTTNTTTNIGGYNNAGSPNTTPGSGVGGDGSDNTGTGSGGSGSGDGSGSEPGAPGEGVGTLYESDGRTLTDAFSDFWTVAQATPLIQKVNNFFGNCAFSGACPVWTYDGGEMMGQHTFDALCTGALDSLILFGAAIVLAMGAFQGFRIAIY